MTDHDEFVLGGANEPQRRRPSRLIVLLATSLVLLVGSGATAAALQTFDQRHTPSRLHAIQPASPAPTPPAAPLTSAPSPKPAPTPTRIPITQRTQRTQRTRPPASTRPSPSPTLYAAKKSPVPAPDGQHALVIFVNDLDRAVHVTVNDVSLTVAGKSRSKPVRIQSFFPGAPPDSATGKQTDDAYEVYFADDRSCGQADSGGNFLDPDTSPTLHIYARAGRECGPGGPTAPDLKVNPH